MPLRSNAALRHLLALLGLNEKRCAFCLTPFIPDGDETICRQCLKSMIDTVPRCTLCGEKLGTGGICGTCITRKRPWDGFLSLGAYAGILREAVLQGKFNANLPVLEGLGRTLGQIWQRHAGASIRFEEAWTLLPVPLHQRKLAIRGFNQCAEIGRGLTRVATGIHLDTKSLIRIRNTTTQRNLSKAERWKNITSAFACSNNVQGQCCIILDDVMTTGATIEAATDAVLKAGARKVYALAVARDDRHEYR